MIRSCTSPRLLLFLTLFVIGCAQSPATVTTTATQTSESSSQARQPKSRRFEFKYEVTIKEIPVGATVNIWLPQARSKHAQKVHVKETTFPVVATKGNDPKYGNPFYFLEIPGTGKPITCSITYTVERLEVVESNYNRELSDSGRKLFLGPNILVPVGGRSTFLIENELLAAAPLAIGRHLYDTVDSHVKYNKDGTGWGQGNVEWVCDSGYGNCSDFHSLFISLARFHKLPAHFEIGFPIPEQRGTGSIGGYHCWASFHTDKFGWVPVDISEADKHPELKEYYFGNLSENRISMSIGRDLTLSDQQKTPPINFFVYPHAELNGKLLPEASLATTFTYRDLD